MDNDILHLKKLFNVNDSWYRKYCSFPPDMSVPPPPITPGISSLSSSLFSYLTCPAAQWRDISLRFKEIEKNLFLQTKATNLPPHNAKNSRYCSTCSEFSGDGGPRPTYHLHQSSKLRRIHSSNSEWGTYSCDQCKSSPHHYLQGARLPLLITSSTLCDYHGTRNNVPFVGDKIHCDTLAVPGGNFKSLRRAFLAEYSQYPLPLDVLCTLGLNDVANATISSGDILPALVEINKSALELREAVLDSAPSGCVNSFALCTLPFPPKFTCVESDCTIGDFQLRTQLLSAVNESFKQINKETAHITCIPTSSPFFHTWGLSCKNRTASKDNPQLLGVPVSARAHRYSNYREQEPDMMLHFNDKVRVRMGLAVNMYFVYMYGFRISLGENKNEGVQITKKLKKDPRFCKLMQIPVEQLRARRGVYRDPMWDCCEKKDMKPSHFN